MSLQYPQQIHSRYDVQKVLGQGTGGTSLLAHDTKRNRLVAIKLLSKNQSHDESSLLKKLHHPNISHVLDEGEEGDFFYYVSEYIEGENIIQAALKRDWNAIFHLIVQTAWALQYLHDRQILHGDIKPDNILVGRAHRESGKNSDRMGLKIIDFGLAQSISDIKRHGGSLAYMAPEVLSGDPYDHRADLYSFGIVLYELAFGKLPLEMQKHFSVYLKKLETATIDLSPLKEWSLPTGIIEIIRHLTEKDLSKRLAMARDIILLLNQYEQESFPLEAGEVHLPKPRSQPIPSQKMNRQTQMEPQEIVSETQRLARGGNKQSALEFASTHFETLPSWTDPSLLEDFYATVIHALIEQGKTKNAEDLFRQMENHPTLKGHPTFERELLSIHLAYRQGQLKEMERCLQNLSQKQIQKMPADKHARLETYRALLAQEKKKWKEAAKYYEKASTLSEISARKDHSLSLLINAASLYFRQGEWTHSHETYQRASHLARELKNDSLLATILNNLGNLYLYFGRWNEAKTSLLESLDLSQAQDLKALSVSNLCLLSVAEDGKGNWEDVKRILDDAFGQSKDLDDAEPALQCLLARGYYELSQKDYGSCEETIQTLSERARSSGNDTFLSQANWLCAKLHIAEGRPEEVLLETMLTKLKTASATAEQPHILWQIEADFSELYYKREDLKKARQHGREALRLLEAFVQKIPSTYRESFYRDRKKEKILRLLREIEAGEAPTSQKNHDIVFSFSFVTSDTTSGGIYADTQ